MERTVKDTLLEVIYSDVQLGTFTYYIRGKKKCLFINNNYYNFLLCIGCYPESQRSLSVQIDFLAHEQQQLKSLINSQLCELRKLIHDIGSANNVEVEIGKKNRTMAERRPQLSSAGIVANVFVQVCVPLQSTV